MNTESSYLSLELAERLTVRERQIAQLVQETVALDRRVADGVQPGEASQVHIYQIYYDKATRDQIDPGFLPLDNCANERPDWREYWPMRRFLLNSTLAEDAYYGFFSPKFRDKTGLSAEQVLKFARQGGTDVIGFSPYFDQGCIFLNVFEQGEQNHPGFLKTASECLQLLDINQKYLQLPGHTGNSVFCNFFVAKPAFWRAWLFLTEQLFALCEADDSDLGRRLNAQTSYVKNVAAPMKVFLIERVVSILLAGRGFSSISFNPYTLPMANFALLKYRTELLSADALKIAHLRTGNPEYLLGFYATRKRIVDEIKAAAFRS